MQSVRVAAALAVAACFTCNASAGSGGPLGIDHRLTLDESGIWSRSNQHAVEYGSALLVVGGALYEGDGTRLGRTFWKASEAMVAADLAAGGLKLATRRARPNEGNDPDDWFGPRGHRSFPSGEVTHITAIVTPFIAEYAHDQPAVWALAALPAYVGAARLKSQAHWQTDVLAGIALGAGVGYYEFNRKSAWVTTVVPHGLAVGLRTRF